MSYFNNFKLKDDGQNLALVSYDNVIQYLSSNNVEKPGQIFNGHNGTIRSVDISHDGKLLISASDDKTCKIWSLKKPLELLMDIQSLKITESTVFYFLKLNFKAKI